MDELKETVVEEEYKIWRKNVPFLYDLMYSHVLTWPSPSVQWFPSAERVDNRFTSQRLLLTTFANGADTERLLIGSVSFPDTVDDDCVSTADIRFKFSQTIPLPVDINRLRYSPAAPNLIACRSDRPEVLLYDYTKHPSSESRSGPDALLSGHSGGGFAIDWNPQNWKELSSGGKDSLVCTFDINSGLVRSSSVHSAIVNDISYSHFDPHQFCSVSDDLQLVVHDTRRSPEEKNELKVEKAHFKTIESVATSPLRAELLATGSSDNSIKIWDLRSLKSPLTVLRGHKDSVTTVKWSPHYESLLASSSPDHRAIIWDLNRTDAISDSLESTEILFVHGGHTSVVEDIDWNPVEPMELATISNDGLLHIWRVNFSEYI